MSDSIWDEGDGGSQEKQLDRVSQEDILSPEMQGLTVRVNLQIITKIILESFVLGINLQFITSSWCNHATYANFPSNSLVFLMMALMS